MMEIMLGTENLANYPGIVRSSISEESPLLKIILKKILSAGTKNFNQTRLDQIKNSHV